MNKEEVWRIYTQKNPCFEQGDPISFTAAGLRKFFDQTWNLATKESQEQSTESHPFAKKSQMDDTMKIFRDVFGNPNQQNRAP
jgi:hypothetical protein